MHVRVKLFGNLGYYLPEGTNRFSLTKVLTQGATARELVKELNLPEKIPVIMIVNGGRVSGDYVLKDGDEVTLFRPTGGG